MEGARAYANQFTSTFDKDIRYYLGEDHWPITARWTQNVTVDALKSKTIRNYTFATIRHKKAVVMDATPSIHVEPLDDDVTFDERQAIAAAVKHELERVNWDGVTEDVFDYGSICGVGIAMCRTEQDKLSGQHKLCIDIVDPARFYPDRKATRLEKARAVGWEPRLPLSTIMEMFPDKGYLVKPNATSPLRPPAENYVRTNDEIIYGPGTDTVLGKDGSLKEREADVCFVWIKQDELAEEIQRNTQPGSQAAYPTIESGTTTGMTPDTGTNQGAPDVSIGRKYPFGRLIVYSGEILLFDGPNPYNLPGVFPFAAYVHYRIPKRFWGYGDVALLKSPQMVADKNMAQIIEAIRSIVNAPFEYPAEAEAYTNLGNHPGQMIPTPLPYCGKARYVGSERAFNAQLWQMADEINIRDFQRVSGVSDVSTGTAPVAPTSGVEIEARTRAASTGIGRHLEDLNRFRSDLASLVWQVMQQYYVGPRSFMAKSPMSEFESILLDCSQLPPGVAVKVDANIDSIQKDKLMGQNLALDVQQGVFTNPEVQPFLSMLLAAQGVDPVTAREVKETSAQIIQSQMQTPKPVTDPGQLLVALSDGHKVGLPLAINQWEAALQMAGLPPPQGPALELPAPEPTPGANGSKPAPSKNRMAGVS